MPRVVYTQPYRPLAVVPEASDAVGFSTRYYRDARRNANVAKGHLVAATIMTCPAARPGAAGTLVEQTSTGEQFFAQLAFPAYRGYTTIDWRLWGYQTTGSTGTSTVRVYCDVGPYIGAAAFNAALLSGEQQSSSATMSVIGIANGDWHEGAVTVVRPRTTQVPISYLIVTVQRGATANGVGVGYVEAEFRAPVDEST